MILWLDGCFGIGKTTVADAIIEMLPKKEAQIMSADMVFRDEVSKNKMLLLGGYPLQHNEIFIQIFKERVESAVSLYKNVIIDMSLVDSKLKEDPIKYFVSHGYDIIHLVLYAVQDEVVRRIKNDPQRDQQFALNWVSSQASLLERYKNDIHIETTGKSPVEIAREIGSLAFKGEL